MYKTLISFLVFTLLSFCLLAQAQSSNTIAVLDVQGAIGPATQEYVTNGLAKASRQQVSAVILQLDTPGGLSKSMRGIIKAMLASPVPVIVYVAPSGARAASAGTYMLYAAQIAAMAPGTNLGAATPVNLISSKKDKQSKPSASEVKALNDVHAYIRSLAQLRGRNLNWAEQAVRKGASLSAKEALRKQVIDIIAPNMASLLQQLDGRTVKMATGQGMLETHSAQVIDYFPDWRTKLLSVITNPTIAYIFLIIAFYGLFFEFTNPGFILPGVAGAISLFLGLYGLHMLPINYVGLALIMLGLVFCIAEVFVTSFGALGVGGIACFVVGSVMLMNTDVVGYSIPWGIILGVSITTALFVFMILQLVLRSRRKPKTGGFDVLLGQGGEISLADNTVWVRVNGELWKVINNAGLSTGDRVVVTQVNGMQVTVKKEDS